MKVQGISEEQITGELKGDDYVWSWPAQDTLKMQVAVYADGNQISKNIVEGTEYVHAVVETNVNYTYVFKVTDGANFSEGTIKKFFRELWAKITEYATRFWNWLKGL